jgi:hypothetical protein
VSAPTLPALPCAAAYYDTRSLGRAVWGPPGRHDQIIGHHDGWRPCPAPATHDVTLADRSTRHLCAEHARQISALAAHGLAGRLRWR